MHEIIIDRYDGHGRRTYLFEAGDFLRVQRMALEAIDQGWKLIYTPARSKEPGKPQLLH